MAKTDFERYVISKGGSGADVTIDPVSGKVSVSGTGGHIAPYVSPSAVEAVENIWDRGGKYNGPGSTAAADGGVALAGALTAVPNMNKPIGVGVAANALDSVNPANPTPAATPEAGTGGVNGGVTSPGGSVNVGGNVGGAVTVPDTPPGGTVGGTAAGGAATAPAWEAPVLPAATDQSQYIRELYEAQQEAKLAAAERAYNQSMAAIEKQAATIPEYYYEAGRQTAGLNAREVQAMNERFNASGLNTGASGQAALAQNAVYQGNMAAIRQAEANALAEVEADRASLAIDYQNQIREAILNNETEKAQALYAEMLRVDESIVDTAYKQAGLDLTAKEFQFGVDKYNQGRADEKAAEDRAAAERRAEVLASIGDFSGYAALGYSAEEIAALKSAWDAANGTVTGGGYSAPPAPSDTQPAIETPTGTGGANIFDTAHATQIYGSIVNGTMDNVSLGYTIMGAYESGLISEKDMNALLDAAGV